MNTSIETHVHIYLGHFRFHIQVYDSIVYYFWQVDGRCVTLNEAKSERAMMIKDNLGDWAVIKARWEGRKPSIKVTF